MYSSNPFGMLAVAVLVLGLVTLALIFLLLFVVLA